MWKVPDAAWSAPVDRWIPMASIDSIEPCNYIKTRLDDRLYALEFLFLFLPKGISSNVGAYLQLAVGNIRLGERHTSPSPQSIVESSLSGKGVRGWNKLA